MKEASGEHTDIHQNHCESDFSSSAQNTAQETMQSDVHQEEVDEVDNEALSREEFDSELVKKWQTEAEEFKQKFYYQAAEFENSKRRGEKERESLIKYAHEKVLTSLLDTLDNFDRTIEAIEKDQNEAVKNIFVGIQMVQNQFNQALVQNGLTAIDALGKIFDPNFHEALMQKDDPEAQDQQILQVFQKGYTLNGRLIRPAKVVVCHKTQVN